jgi:glycerophosphoryl diester phosphodiesterase
MDWRRASAAGLLLITLWTVPAGAFQVIGHRGSRGYRPENTIAAFQKAVRLGANVVEADLLSTRDGYIVVSHERRITRLLCRGPHIGRLIKKLTLKQVRRHDCGTRRPPDPKTDVISRTQRPVKGAHIPELGQILRLIRPTRARLLLEIKVDPTNLPESPRRRPFLRQLRHLVRKLGMVRRVAVESYDWRSLKLLRRMEPRIKRVGLASSDTIYPGSPWLGGVRLHRAPEGKGIVRAAARTRFDGIAPDADLVTRTMVATAHARGLRVLPYTVDSPKEMARLIALGIDGLITDYPDRLRRQARLAGRRL